ncbi:hypothetical protein [Aureliella helgolandensis]|uniref:Uncharacterized protein n=1 Tax=Aureliella helgolandensis TaxID=2527968 RepID=A0A518G3Z0_9BACT|nr:hypothetical protein [Aureliella helgolandensis]QDV23316.1 hypothetical protein Q31a_16140 [Aureliella helgolandensis]
MFWPIVWFTFMVGLIVATIVVARKEKKARLALAKPTTPQPLTDSPGGLADPASEGFGEQDPVAGFELEDGDAVAALDDDPFK